MSDFTSSTYQSEAQTQCDIQIPTKNISEVKIEYYVCPNPVCGIYIEISEKNRIFQSEMNRISKLNTKNYMCLNCGEIIQIINANGIICYHILNNQKK